MIERDGDVRIMRIPGSSVLCSITDKTSIVREGYVRWGFSVSMVIIDNFDLIVLPNANATVDNEHYEGVEESGCSPVGCTQVNPDKFRHYDKKLNADSVLNGIYL